MHARLAEYDGDFARLLRVLEFQGWELEDIGFRHKTRRRANDPGKDEVLWAAVQVEEARILGTSAHDLIYRRRPGWSHATVGRRIRAARELLEREPEWRPGVEGLARSRLSG
ncbi:MAG TPA: hypothetical protein VNK94_11690 [Gaiellaceae bacterium]|nr:hypothetical protein [Gaiellaceae bacterium]